LGFSDGRANSITGAASSCLEHFFYYSGPDANCAVASESPDYWKLVIKLKSMQTPICCSQMNLSRPGLLFAQMSLSPEIIIMRMAVNNWNYP